MDINATLSEVLKNKEIPVYGNLYNHLPESTLAEKLYKLRKLNGLSMKKFARKINMSASTIAHWEAGYQKLSMENMIKICDVFGLSLSEWESFM
jgi:DNA-binding transcriptional regulator YiaG